MKSLEKFGGISFSLFEIRANSFDGYGFTFIEIGWNWMDRVCISFTYPMVYFNVIKRYEYGGEEWQVRGGILGLRGVLYTKVLKPRKSVCDNCGDYCESTEFYEGSTPYCSRLCNMDGTL